MTKRGLWLWAVTVLLLATFVQTVLASPNPAPPTPGKNAGRISALLPVAKISRGTGRAAVVSEAKRGDELVWNDLVKTEKGGRARITLADQSILSLGSQSELRIVKHDARAQQTTLQMAYGRVRAQVASITRDRGSFELRTPTAVAGVIGTDFGVDSSAVGGDTFVCLAGAVQVSNADPNVAGSVQCNAGQTTTVMPGKAPTTPKPATLQQLQQLIEDTEPAIIASISPAAALPGTEFDSTIAGAKMGKVKSVSVAGGSGVSASIKSANDASVVIHVVIDQSASAGPRTITLEKEVGASSATVFTVLGGITGDPKKAYLETIEQLRTTGVGGLSAFLAGAQQAADQVAQQITSANQNLPKPLDLTPLATSLTQQYTGVQSDLNTSTDAITKAANEAANTFGSLYDAAYQQLLQRDPTGAPDSTFKTALTNAFTQANGVLQSAISNAQTGLTSSIQNYGQSLNQIQNTWSQSINDAFQAQQAGPLPKVNALERIVELGAEASFDASRSAASNSSTSINSFKWVLCDKSYQPSGFGQQLPEGASACNALPGYASTNSEFVIPTCSLQPGPYFARLEVTDSNNKTSRMDVRLTVLQPGYGSPAEALRGLADGYSTLQLSEFMKWFDRTLFQGYTSLSENVRQTLETLSSMNINLRVSQESATCNDATVRADWQQNYTFASDPKTVLAQQEQLTVAMKRTPGVGWLITEFRGDNGQVQGLPPAVSDTDTAAPSIIVECISPGEQCLSTSAARTAVRRGISVPGGGIFAVLRNVGSPLNSPLKVRFEVGGQTEDVDIPIPFEHNETKRVSSTLTFLPSPNGVTITATVNPTRLQPEVDFTNHTRSVTTTGVPDYVIRLVSFKGHNAPFVLESGEIANVQVTVSNIGGTSASGQLKLTVDCGNREACPNPAFLYVDAPAAGSEVTASIEYPVTFPVGAYAGTLSMTADIPDAIIGPAVQLPFSVIGANYVITSVVFEGHTSPYNLQFGETTNLVVTVSNTGGASPAGTITLTANCGVPAACPNPNSVQIDAPAATKSVTTSLPFTIDLPVGAYAGSVSIATQIPNAVVGPAFPESFNVVDFTLTTVPQSILTGVVGRPFSTLAVAVTPNYPLPLSYNYTGLPTGLNGSGTSITGTPTAPTAQTATVTVSATSFGVTHTAELPIQIDILDALTMTPGPAVDFIAGGVAKDVSFDVAGGHYPVTINFTLPTGFSIASSPTQNGDALGVSVVGSVATVSIGGPGVIVFPLTAATTAATGNFNFSVQATDTASSATAAGSVTAQLPFSVAGAANYVITSVSFAGHSAPYNLQFGEATNLVVTVANTGGANPTGLVTLTASCGVPAACPTPNTLTLNMPADLGIPISIPLTIDLVVGTYPGSISLATQIPNATVGPAFNQPFNVVDFALTTVPQSILTGVAGRTFNTSAVTVTPANYPLALTYNYTGLPTGLNGSGTSITGTPTAGTVQPATVTVSATSFGVTHTANLPIQIDVANEIVLTPGPLVAFTAGGAAQNVVFNLVGGIYPVAINLTLPNGFTSAANATVNGTPHPVTVNGNIASITTTGSGQVVFSLTADSTAAGGANLNFSVQATDAGFAATNTAAGNAVAFLPYSVAGLPDLVFDAAGVQSIFQANDVVAFSIPVKNAGNADAAGGWSLDVSINGQASGGVASGPPILAGQTVNVSFNLQIPPASVVPTVPPENVTFKAVLNLNNKIQESNTSNNTFTQNATLADFALTATNGVAQGVVGRTFNFPAVTVQPTPYPFQLSVSYTGLVAGLQAIGTVDGVTNLLGSTIVGTPTATTTGNQNVMVTGTVGSASHNANQSVVINVTSEISVKPGVTPTFSAGGAQATQAVTLVVQGGIYPLTINFTLPQGFTSAATATVGGVSTPVTIVGSVASVTMSAAGNVVYTLTADATAAAGNGLSFSVNATDQGYNSPATGAVITPVGSVSANIPYNVAGLPDLQFGAVSLPNVLQIGNPSTLNLPVQNNGNAGAAAGWDVVATINGVTAGTATVAALPANQSTIVNLVVTPPQTDPPPVNKSYPVVITLNASNLIQESNTANNTFSSNLNLADFTLTTQAASVQGIVGRLFDFTTVDIAPAPYPITPVSVGFSTLPAGITQQPGISPNGLNGARIAGTPTAAGNTGIAITGSLFSVTHNASSPLQVIVSPEITITQVGTTGLQTGGAAQPFTINVTGGVYPVTLKLTLPTGITTADGTLGAGFSTQTLAGPGNVTWNISADVTAVTGGSLPISVQATDPGVPTTATPAGNISFNGLYSVGGAANYVITDATFENHTAPYVGAQALQIGENTNLLVTVKNEGSASPSGTITVNADCGLGNCPLPPVTIAAPNAGQSVIATVPATNIDLAIASYNGKVSISVDNGGAIGPQFTVPFDAVDFTFTANTLAGGDQNLPIGGSGVLNFSLAVQVPQGSPFGIPITPSTYPNLSFTPASQTVSGASIDFTVNVGAAQQQTGGTSDTITFTATNHGVSKVVNVPVVFFNAMLQPQNLFVNDAANPLVVPISTDGQAPSNYPTIELKMLGNYTGGDATLAVQQPCGPFVANTFPAAASPGALVSLPIYAATGNTCPAGTPLIVNANIQNTRPSLTIPVYTVYLAPKGEPVLSLVKATPSRDISTIPWYSGEALDWDVDVKNTGSSDSAGNEKISFYLSYNGRDTFIGSAVNPNPILAGQTVPVRVHTIGYDVFKDDPTQSGFGSVRVTLRAGDPRDVSPTVPDLNFEVLLENWWLANVADGDSDANALPVEPGTGNGTSVQLASRLGNQFPDGFLVTLVPGAYSKPQLNAPTFAPPTLSPGFSSEVDVQMPVGITPYSGYYYAQVIAQLKDGGVVTAQRETTIHFTVSTATDTAVIDLASDVKNIAACPNGVCGAPPNTLQVNGPLPEPFNLTASVNGCTGTCTGSADIHFTDNYQTITTPISQTVDLVAPNNVLNGRVKAADNPDGSINIGPASVNISVTNIQAAKPAVVRTPTPQPVGDNQYIMAVNIGDIGVNSIGCVGLVPGDPTPVALPLVWNPQGGFNATALNWEWQDSNHVPVATTPVAFSFSAGASNYSAGTYDALPTINISNVSDGTIGLVTYYFAVTVSNSLGTATKYFPFQFDLSQGQTLCPIINAARGSAGTSLIRGSWGKAGLSAPLTSSVRVATPKVASTKLPDVQINASDISFTPSYPKAGDTVAIRFRLTNTGDADAKAVPIALQINGTTVVSDTFDVAAGKSTLAGLQWSNAQMPGPIVGSIKPAALKEKLSGDTGSTTTPGMTAALVVDPQHTVSQKTTTAKSAALAHFRMQPGTGIRDSIGVSADQRVVLALGEGACAALRFAVGAGFCPRGDVTVTVDDLAKGIYKLESDNGVADLGFNNTNYSNANFSSQVLAQSGHNYAVKLDGGRVGILTMQAVRNPEQLSEAAKRLFRQRAVLVVKGLGSGTGAPEVGDLANRMSDAMVYFDVVYQGQ